MFYDVNLKTKMFTNSNMAQKCVEAYADLDRRKAAPLCGARLTGASMGRLARIL
jgi:hypothetical protein